MRRIKISVLIIALLVIGLIICPTPIVLAEAGPTFFDAMVPMRDGIQLYTRVYLPDSDIWGPGPYPIILQRTPYGIGMADSDQIWPREIELGYARVDQDTRGRYSSQGLDRLFYDDISDGHDTLDWIAAQNWCDGNIGVTGYSAPGITTFLAAGEHHPNLKAIAPLSSSGNLMNDLTFERGAFRGDALIWGVGQTAFGLSTVTDGHRDLLGLTLSEFEAKRASVMLLAQELVTYVEWHNPTLPNWPATYHQATESKQWMHLPLYDFHDALSTLQPYMKEILSHPSQDEWRDHYKVYDTVDVPTLLVTGWYDFFVRCQVDAFVALQERDIPVKLIVGPGTHGDPPFGADGLYEYVMKWFDYWLKGIDNGIMDESPIHYYCLEADEWRWADQWPPVKARYVNYYLHEGEVLSTDLPTGGEGPASYTYDPSNPVLTMGGANEPFGQALKAGSFDQTPVVLDRDDILSYTTRPLTEDVEITGPLTVVLSTSSDCTDTDFTAKLIDVYPTGELMLVADGIIRARYRDSMTTPELMEPTTVYKITFDIGHISHLFKSGHRIRVDISSSNFPKYDRNLNTGGVLYRETEWVVAENIIYHDADNPSYIMLPVVKDWGDNVEPSPGICFIATAAYGTPMAEEIQILREFRDEYLLPNSLGQAFVNFYYNVSPPIAEFIIEHPVLKPIVRVGLLPAVAMSTLAVNTTPAEKITIVGLSVLVSVILAVWVRRQRRVGLQCNEK
jgi:putative CocE/NonD family hydrolase